jgi:demethylmenaquinone methyltransferase/2-methoxy-6-polyprenyl-1,4-benzoquinol methylase
MSPTLTLNIREKIQTPGQKKAYNAGLFTRVATEYDTATRAMSLGQDSRWKQRLVSLLPTAAQPRCVDLACETGDVTLELAERFPDGEILGVDLTEPMLTVARQRNRRSNVRFVQGDMCRLELPDGWANVVTGSYALRNAPVLAEALAEVRRVLRPGGYAAFLDFVKPANRWRARAQLALLKSWCGAVSILVHGRPEHAYIAESLRQFPDRPTLHRQLAGAGLPVVATEAFLAGLVEIFVVRRTA